MNTYYLTALTEEKVWEVAVKEGGQAGQPQHQQWGRHLQQIVVYISGNMTFYATHFSF